jgi:hypothetical protein
MHRYQRAGKAPSLLATVDRNQRAKASSKKKKFLSGKKSAVIASSRASSGAAFLSALPDFTAVAGPRKHTESGLKHIGRTDLRI